MNHDKELFLRYLDWFLERMKGWTNPVRLNKGRKFLQKDDQKASQTGLKSQPG